METTLETLITYNPWTLTPSTSVGEAARLLDETGVRQWAIVDDGGAPLGTLLASALWPALQRDPTGQAPLAALVDQQAAPIALGSDSLAALQHMLATGRRMLPVTDGGRVVGTLSTTDFVRELSYGGRAARELMLEHMHKVVETIDADLTLEQALPQFMNATQPLVVVQGDFPLGALTSTGLKHALVQEFARRQRGVDKTARTLGQMLQSCPTIPPGRTLGEAAGMLVEHQLDALAVANQAAHLLGVVTEEHLLRAILTT